ncbi:tetratricopeptide repeat protein [Chitinophaga sp. Hz27]|uniref:tetratricopeptide repeat protein n=1 Tax=Chitinophaga sp. Hz27 TaxID=3347169 RepID=UPI0035E35260
MNKYITVIFLLCFTFEAQAQFLKKKKSSRAGEYYEQAVQETKQQHYEKAIDLSLKALHEQPDFIDQELLLAKLYLLTRRYDQARKYTKSVLEKDPKYKDAYYFGINIEMSTNNYPEAECYVDEALSQFPGSKDFMVKKLEILDVQKKLYRGDQWAENILEHYPDDTTVKRAYVDHYLQSGFYQQQQGNFNMARQSFDKVLAIEPQNKEAREAGLGTELRGGNLPHALDVVNNLLTGQPDNYDLLMKKLGILQEMHAYADALSVLQQIYRRYPNDAKARSLETALRMEAASYYTNTDPYSLYLSVLEKNPGNREALDKVIGYCMARGAYMEALAWINKGLRSSPNDTRLLNLKMDVLEGDHRYGAAAAIAEVLYQRAPNADLRDRLVNLEIQSGRQYMAEEQYDLALAAFQTGLKISPRDTTLLGLIINTYSSLKDNKAALKATDNALSFYPDNEKFLLRKASLLETAGDYDGAATVLTTLSSRHPNNEAYKGSLAELRLAAARNLMRAEEFDLAKQQLYTVLEVQPENRDALDYMINLQSATHNLDSALWYNDKALSYYPNDKDLLLKKSSVLQDEGRYNEAAAIAAELMVRYPYTAKFKTAYINSEMSAGTAYQRNQQPDSALAAFNKVLELNPKDSLALLYSINQLNGQQRYDSAMGYVNQALKYYPDNENFLLKRVNTLENKKDYAAASLAADTLAKRFPTANNKDYYDLLAVKTMKNQFGLYYLNSTYDYTDNRYNIATVEYRRFIKKGSYAFRLDYAGRQNGNGLQGEAEMYYVHNPKLYSYGLITFSNKVVFPQVRAAYSLFKTFKHDIEVELGARYLNLDSVSSVSGVVSVAKPFGDFWVNLRAYVISEPPRTTTSFNLTTRYYTTPAHTDFISLIAGLGTSPDDRSRLINYEQLSGLLTHSVAAGYQKVFKYRTTVGLYGTWINSKLAPNQYGNQYDIYVVLMRKF